MIANTRVVARVTVGAVLLGFGITKLFAQVFLGNWQMASNGEADIAARGVWLLAAYLPIIAVAAALIALALVGLLTRRIGLSSIKRLAIGAIGGVAGALAIVFGLDPITYLVRLVPWSSPFAFYVTGAILALAIILIGCVTIARSSLPGGNAVAA